MSTARLLEQLAARYRLRRRAAHAVFALGAGILAAGDARAAGLGTVPSMLAGTVVAVTVVMLSGWWNRRRPARAVEVARHLDRTIPAVEESTELLLDPAGDTMGLVGRLERARVERAISAAGPIRLPPDRTARPALIGGLLAAAAGTLLLTAVGPVHGTAGAGHPEPPAPGTLIGGARIIITPPAYTGAPARTITGWDADVPEGTAVAWRVASRADRAWLVTSAGDTLPMRRAGGEDTVTVRASAAFLYQVAAEAGGRRAVSDFHRIGVVADAPPTVVIAAPRGRLRLNPGDAQRVPVEVRAGDDWGTGAARLVATLTSGEGEAVKFREQTFSLAPAGRRSDLPHGVTLGTVIDLAALGLKPGDELYFHAEVTDRREPRPNTGRSETVFIALADTGGADRATIAGIAVTLAPEYFRSQRQIIMDTEKLLADRPRITREAFQNRSGNIGLDQGLLRDRYGQYVGDESETGEDPVAGHQHDTPENTTLLAASVKTELKAALAQMWDAELRLRTYRPAEALPYEYRALAHLKQAQQSARVYVQRVGFEPPPLDPAATRLTGKLDAIISRTDRDSAGGSGNYPATRAAIAALSGSADRPSDAALILLERALAELAPRAAQDSTVFATVRAARAVVDSARLGRRCAGCTAHARDRLLGVVPPAEPAPMPTRPAAGNVARRYFELTGAIR
jgi:hypothetical protein